MSDELTRFIPIAKIDEEKRMVWGLASDETVDVEGEITDYEATKEAVAEWQQYANIREMHQASAVGVAQEIILDDASKSLWIGVNVVDDSAWQKCKDGVYKGFSIGGKALRKIAEVIDGRLVRRIVKYLLVEISLVDRPANPSARFSLIKRQGGIDMPEKDKMEMEETPVADEQPEKPSENAPEGETPAEEGVKEPPPTEGAPIQKMDGEGKPEGETEGEEDEHPMNEEMVKQVVLGMLKELGLVREEGQGEGFAQAAEIADLRKSLGSLAPAEDLQKVSGDLKKVVGDIVTVANAIGEIETRLDKVEQLLQGTGPVLLELTFGMVQDQTETILKSLLADATDPQMREAIGQRLAQIQIRNTHQQKSGQS